MEDAINEVKAPSQSWRDPFYAVGQQICHLNLPRLLKAYCQL